MKQLTRCKCTPYNGHNCLNYMQHGGDDRFRFSSTRSQPRGCPRSRRTECTVCIGESMSPETCPSVAVRVRSGNAL